MMCVGVCCLAETSYILTCEFVVIRGGGGGRERRSLNVYQVIINRGKENLDTNLLQVGEGGRHKNPELN